MDLTTSHEVMPNGEQRYRFSDPTGLGYILTEASAEGGWQESHFHRALLETYIVQDGWIAVAELGEAQELRLRILRPTEMWTATPGVAHNVFMGPGAVTHVVKHGAVTEQDRAMNEATARLDSLCKPLMEADILARG